MIKVFPRELWTKIFEFDSTYRHYMREYILPYIHGYEVYEGAMVVVVLEKALGNAYVSNSMVDPFYISLNHSVSPLFVSQNFPGMKKRQTLPLPVIQNFIHFSFC
jgi:hypothetical protein